MLKLKKYCFIILPFLVFILLWPNQVGATSEIPFMYSGAYALTDGRTNRVLLGKNENLPMANASTTKILTCIYILEVANLEDMVTISSNAANQPKVRLGMKEGEEYPLKDLLYGLMLESYNDCAVALAEHVSGSVEAFVQALNTKAVSLNCEDTYFLTPNGLDLENEDGFHHSTAEDLCRIMSYCVWDSPKKEEFLLITQSLSYSGDNGEKIYHFSNKNALLSQMEGLLSGKTGYTAKAGYCYVAAYEEEDERFCIALLACGWPNNKNYKWQDAKALLNYGRVNYNNVEIKPEEYLEQIPIEGYQGTLELEELFQENYVIGKGKFPGLSVLLEEEEHVRREIVGLSEKRDVVHKGEILGRANYYIGELLLYSVPIVATENSYEWNTFSVFRLLIRQYVDFY